MARTTEVSARLHLKAEIRNLGNAARLECSADGRMHGLLAASDGPPC